jgi:hypothetical protein
MKKLLWVVVIATTLFATLNAKAQSIQSEINEFQGFNGIAQTQKIITENANTMIAFSKTDLSNNPYVFYRIINGSVNADIAELPSQFEVKDMAILNDTLYFCGQINGTDGYIAKSYISDLFYNQYFEWDILQPDIASVDKIEAYNRNTDNAIQIVALGTKKSYSNSMYFIHCDEMLGWQYQLYWYWNTYGTDFLDDLEISDKFVITTGRINAQGIGSGITIRVYDRDNISNSYDTMFGYVNYYAFNQFHAKIIDNHKLAVVGTANYGINPVTLVMIADITVNPMIHVQTQWFDGYGNHNIKVKDLAYFSNNPNDKKLLILESVSSSMFPNNPFDAVIEYDYTSTYPTTDIYYSIDLYNNNLYYNGIVEYQPFQFAAIGTLANYDTPVILWYGDRNQYGNFSCNIVVQENLNDETPISISITSSQFESINLVWQNESTNNYSLSISIICLD